MENSESKINGVFYEISKEVAEILGVTKGALSQRLGTILRMMRTMYLEGQITFHIFFSSLPKFFLGIMNITNARDRAFDRKHRGGISGI